MKVNIGKHPRWIGSYQIAFCIPFINKDTQYRIGEWLETTWVGKFCIWVHSYKDRKIDIRIDDYDTWSMDHTLALIVLPMLKRLKDHKKSSPVVDDEDLPERMRYSDPKGEYGVDNWHHYKWEWILNEMIWAFEHIVDDSWENKFYHGSPKFESIENEYGAFVINQVNEDYWVDREGLKEYNDRIDNGLRLFGKYYRSLWS